MHPILFTIFGKAIYTYGFMAMLGLLAAVGTWYWLARRETQYGGDFPTTFAIWLMLPGIVGARAAYVIANWSYFSTHASEIIRTDHGGLIFYGGFIAAFLALVICAKVRRFPLLALCDFAVPALAIGHAFGRLGCLMFGCCHGSPITCADGLYARLFGLVYPLETPMGHQFPDIPLHPVQVYETAGLLLLWAGLLLFRRRLVRHPGLSSALYLLCYAPLRFGLEFLRGDPRQPGLCGLNVAQTVSIGLFMAGVALLFFVLARPTPERADS